mmetsp:Transcript_916/g.2301  ORF Transcript_916/g.2301 Transcript_916/m.2301 type:complete len:209 (-) Transcript_916:101-727(-)
MCASRPSLPPALGWTPPPRPAAWPSSSMGSARALQCTTAPWRRRRSASCWTACWAATWRSSRSSRCRSWCPTTCRTTTRWRTRRTPADESMCARPNQAKATEIDVCYSMLIRCSRPPGPRSSQDLPSLTAMRTHGVLQRRLPAILRGFQSPPPSLQPYAAPPPPPLCRRLYRSPVSKQRHACFNDPEPCQCLRAHKTFTRYIRARRFR